MLRYRLVRSLLMAAVVMVAIPQAANAQPYANRILSFDVMGGYAFPMGGSFSEIAKGGPTFGFGADYWVSNLVGLRVEADWDLLKGNEDNLAVSIPSPGGPSQSDISGAPNITLTHLTGGLDFDFINQPDSRFKFGLFLMGGAVFVNSQKVDFRDPSPDDTEDLGCDPPSGVTNCLIDWQDTYPQFRGGIRLGFEATDCTPARGKVCVEIGLNGGIHWMFGNEADTEPITELYSGASPFSSFQSYPIMLNIRINVI